MLIDLAKAERRWTEKKHSDRNSMTRNSSSGSNCFTAWRAASCGSGCFVACASGTCRTHSSAKNNLPIFETHWLALSMLMVILARGQGSGRVERQCNSPEVSSDGTVGSSSGRGWYPAVSLGSMGPLLRALLNQRSMLCRHGVQVSISPYGGFSRAWTVVGLIFAGTGQNVPRFFFPCFSLAQRNIATPTRKGAGAQHKQTTPTQSAVANTTQRCWDHTNGWSYRFKRIFLRQN